MDQLREGYVNELAEASKRIRSEPAPLASSIWDHVFADKNLVGGET
jgi:hypothetical protein